MQKLLVLISVIILLLIGYLVWEQKIPKVEEPMACTADAKICPDGSAVGRVGPSCEFAECVK